MTHRKPPDPTLAVFRNPVFRRLWLGNIISNFGGIVQTVGAAWLMTALTSSERMVALVQASNALPILLLSVFAGVLADSYDRRRVMLTAQIFNCAAATVLAALAFAGLLTPWLLLGFVFLIGCGNALNIPSWHASVGDVVQRENLPSAVSANSMGLNLTRSIGPGIAGIIVGAAHSSVAFAVNALSYLAIIAALRSWKPRPPDLSPQAESFARRVLTGFRFVRSSSNVKRVMLRSFMFAAPAIAVQSMLPLIVQQNLAGGPGLFGIMLGCFGVGSVLAALLNAKLRQRLPGEKIIRIGFVGYGCCLAVLALSHSPILSGVILCGAGLFWIIVISLLNVTVQLSSPRQLVGRALSLYQASLFGGMAAGSWLAGTLAGALGVGVALAVSSICLFLGALVGLMLPISDQQN